MSGMIAIEGQLNGIVKEYLDYYGFEKSLAAFNDECNRKGKSIVNVERHNNNNNSNGSGGNSTTSLQKSSVINNEMISLFHQGQQREFFKRWHEIIIPETPPPPPSSSPRSSTGDNQRLELELNIHFAIYPFKKWPNDTKAQKESIAHFKNYIETKGRVICQTKEFLPYFGLPYHQSPHEGFPELFRDQWTVELQGKLEEFLRANARSTGQVKLVELFSSSASQNNSRAPTSPHQHETASAATAGVIDKLKQQLIESEKRTMAFMRKFNKVQTDYHGLIGITAELADSLESTLTGKPVTPEYISNICLRLFSSQLPSKEQQQQASIDFTRPGTAGELIRKSLAYSTTTYVSLASVKAHQQQHHQQQLNANGETKQQARQPLPQFDFVKLKRDLSKPTTDNGDDNDDENNDGHEMRQACLLQALRWRLTKADSLEMRQRTLAAYIAGDLLNCRSERVSSNPIIELLKSPVDTLRQQMAQVVNAFASLNHGRSYLASNNELVKCMHGAMRAEREDNYTRKNLLAALQKLSLRHKLQIQMVNENVIETLLDLLENNETLSDYSLEYATALLMNLTLKNVGKRRCAADHKRALKIVSELISNSTIEIQSYINAVLYNILSLASVKSHAKKMNLEGILKEYLAEGNFELNQQRQLIIRKINAADDDASLLGGASEADGLTDLEVDEDEDDEEEDAEMMEVELDSGELVVKQTDELTGDALLLAEYLLHSHATNSARNGGETSGVRKNVSKIHASNDLLDEMAHSSSVLNRPVTPLNLRQSQQHNNLYRKSSAANSSVSPKLMLNNPLKATSERMSQSPVVSNSAKITEFDTGAGLTDTHNVTFNKQPDILAIQSINDASLVGDSVAMTTSESRNSYNRISNTDTSTTKNGNSSPKIKTNDSPINQISSARLRTMQRTPEQLHSSTNPSQAVLTVQSARKNSITKATISIPSNPSSSSTFHRPQYSLIEPRPSSATSIKSTKSSN